MTYPYARIAHSVLKDESLSRRAKLVYCIGKLLLYDRPSIEAPYARLAALSGCCVETVEEAVRELIERRLWGADSQSGQPNIYTYFHPEAASGKLDTPEARYQFAPVPRAVLADTEMGKWSKLVYCVGMVFLPRAGSIIYPSQAHLAGLCGFKTRQAVARHVGELVDRGLWRKITTGRATRAEWANWAGHPVGRFSYVDPNEVYGKERKIG